MGNITIKLAQNSPTAVTADFDGKQITVDRPVEKGGGGLGPMGGQYMLIGIGGCFSSTLFGAAQSRDIQVEGLAVEITAVLAEEGAPRFTDIQLAVSCVKPENPEELAKLITLAEKGCIAVNTIKNTINFSADLKS